MHPTLMTALSAKTCYLRTRQNALTYAKFGSMAVVGESSSDANHHSSTMAPSVSPTSSLLEAPEMEAAVCRALQCDRKAVQSIDCARQQSGAAAEGFMSQCGSMTLTAVVEGRTHELHLFVKREQGKDVAGRLNCFEKEGQFYEVVLPHLCKAWWRGQQTKETNLPDLGPAAYLGTNNLVVMEDLTRRGYGAITDWIWSDIDYDAVQQSLRALARLHAASLLAERRDGVNLSKLAPDLLVENFFTRRPGSAGRRIFDCGADIICDYLLPRLFPRLQVPQTKEEMQRLRDLTRDVYAQLDVDVMRAQDASGVLVVCHGDTWPNNVLVKRDEQGRVEHAVLVDFQMARVGLPAWDVVMFLFAGTRRDFRRKHLDALLKGYHDDLTRFTEQRGLDISKDFSFDVFRASADRLSLQARALGAAYMPLVAGDPEDMASRFEDSEGRATLLLDTATRGTLVSRWCDAKDPRYQDLLQEYVEDLLGVPPAAKVSL